ncbi:MAG TPA: MFS transporter [Myxococcales bacterium]|nr:MFS transporter [Myxococcales bacterium]
MAPGKSSLKAVFAQPPFRTLWLAQFVSVFGDFMELFGVISLITFRLHGTAVDVAMATVAYLAPFSFVAPAAGVLVDRWQVKRVMIASDLIRAFIAASLVLVADVHQIWVVMALLGLVSCFFGPAQSVALRTVVPPQDLLAANAMLAQAFYAVRILSPALAGALVAWLTEKACFWIDAASFLFSASMIARLTVARAPSGGDRSLRGFGRDFLEGNRFIFTHRGLSFAFLASAAAMFMLSSFSPLISVYVRDSLHAGTVFYGAVSSMVGVGLIAGTQAVHRAAKGRSMVDVVTAGLFGLGAGAGILGGFQSKYTAALSTLTIGAAIAFVMVPAQTLSQKETPPAMQGRVSSTFMSLFSISQVLGLSLSGVLAAKLGIRQLFLAAAAALVILSMAGFFWLRPRRAAAEATAGSG